MKRPIENLNGIAAALQRLPLPNDGQPFVELLDRLNRSRGEAERAPMPAKTRRR